MRPLAIALVTAAAAALAQPASYDLIVRNGRVVDGSGSPWYRADVAIRGDAIAAIAPRIEAGAARTIDAGGRIVAPGFIDIHTHARRGLSQVPTAANYVRQGVTTVIEGPDGSSAVPIAPFFAQMEKLDKSVNIASFLGQGSIRSAVVGNTNRKATAEEIRTMVGMVEQGMREGALGLSTGLFYVPGTFTPTDEVIELARAAGRLGGVHESHQRDDAARLLDSVNETIAIGEKGGLPTQISHAKVVGVGNWGRSVDMLRLVDEARARGVDVTIDQYPYTASSTSVAAALIPAWVLEGGREATLARLKESGPREKAKGGIAMMIRDERGGGDPKNVQFASCSFDPSLAGKTLADLTRARGLAPTIRNAAEVVMWIVEQGGCQGIFHAMSERDLVRILRHPATMIASDGSVPVFGEANPHPRSYGTFARVLGTYVREKKVLSLEDAIRKMSAFPAGRLGFTDRGLLRPGLKADLVVFDPATVRDTATFASPHSYAEGFSHVVVNGQVVFEHGEMTASRPGRVLYGAARR
ncbi:MAG TPA: D-aminoacylase [Vicinamibacterales bacterium]|nr:D-aminoacylase [Vicinamibacterales bacterium]